MRTSDPRLTHAVCWKLPEAAGGAVVGAASPPQGRRAAMPPAPGAPHRAAARPPQGRRRAATRPPRLGESPIWGQPRAPLQFVTEPPCRRKAAARPPQGRRMAAAGQLATRPPGVASDRRRFRESFRAPQRREGAGRREATGPPWSSPQGRREGARRKAPRLESPIWGQPRLCYGAARAAV